MNPDFFKGTVVEGQANEELARVATAPQETPQSLKPRAEAGAL